MYKNECPQRIDNIRLDFPQEFLEFLWAAKKRYFGPLLIFFCMLKGGPLLAGALHLANSWGVDKIGAINFFWVAIVLLFIFVLARFLSAYGLKNTSLIIGEEGITLINSLTGEEKGKAAWENISQILVQDRFQVICVYKANKTTIASRTIVFFLNENFSLNGLYTLISKYSPGTPMLIQHLFQQTPISQAPTKRHDQ